MKLTDRLHSALQECARFTEGRNSLYWWRRASMQKLEALGLVESYTPPSLIYSRGKARPYRLTEVGRALLSGDKPAALTPGDRDG